MLKSLVIFFSFLSLASYAQETTSCAYKASTVVKEIAAISLPENAQVISLKYLVEAEDYTVMQVKVMLGNTDNLVLYNVTMDGTVVSRCGEILAVELVK